MKINIDSLIEFIKTLKYNYCFIENELNELILELNESDELKKLNDYMKSEYKSEAYEINSSDNIHKKFNEIFKTDIISVNIKFKDELDIKESFKI